MELSLTLIPTSGMVDLEREGTRKSLTPAVRGRPLTPAPLIGVNCYGVRLSPKERGLEVYSMNGVVSGVYRFNLDLLRSDVTSLRRCCSFVVPVLALR